MLEVERRSVVPGAGNTTAAQQALPLQNVAANGRRTASVWTELCLALGQSPLDAAVCELSTSGAALMGEERGRAARKLGGGAVGPRRGSLRVVDRYRLLGVGLLGEHQQSSEWKT